MNKADIEIQIIDDIPEYLKKNQKDYQKEMHYFKDVEFEFDNTNEIIVYPKDNDLSIFNLNYLKSIKITKIKGSE